MKCGHAFILSVQMESRKKELQRTIKELDDNIDHRFDGEYITNVMNTCSMNSAAEQLLFFKYVGRMSCA